jgi:murein DD-endopeptidase MepM/ murein hydrolase activator NlpD
VSRRLLAACLLAVPLAVGPAPAAADGVVATAPAAGTWVAPLRPLAVIRPFDPPESPYGPGHRGVDLGGFPGAVVAAAGAGIVAFAGMVGGRPVVSIAHADGLRTTYEPVAPSVRAGMPVARGSPLGTLLAGHAGCPVPACLHWGARRGASYLDPLLLLHPPWIRLLPSDGAADRSGRRLRRAGVGQTPATSTGRSPARCGCPSNSSACSGTRREWTNPRAASRASRPAPTKAAIAA